MTLAFLSSLCSWRNRGHHRNGHRRIRFGRIGAVAVMFALLLQIAIPVWAKSIISDRQSSTITQADTLDPSAICWSGMDAASDTPVAHDGDRPSRDYGFSTLTCHPCCQPPLPLDQISAPVPHGAGLRLERFIKLTAPYVCTRSAACARAPPQIS